MKVLNLISGYLNDSPSLNVLKKEKTVKIYKPICCQRGISKKYIKDVNFN